MSRIALKVCARRPSSSVERTSIAVVLSAAPWVKSPRAAASSPTVSEDRSSSSRLRRRLISPRTGTTTLRVMTNANATATSTERPNTISSRRERAASSSSTRRAVVCVTSSIDVLQLGHRREQLLHLRRDLAGVDVACAGPVARRVTARAPRRAAHATRAPPSANVSSAISVPSSAVRRSARPAMRLISAAIRSCARGSPS